jgi:Ni/Fe-hydrogenase subunit HybB-like protein
MAVDATQREAVLGQVDELLAPGQTLGSIDRDITSVILDKKPPKSWYAALFISFLLVGLLGLAVSVLLIHGVGVWGINVPVGWGLAIINFVWWIGIGHAGTLISAVLFLFRQEWRTSINRFAEAMTLFAVTSAGLFPLLHTGRPWMAYWMFPYPNTLGMWPQFRSPLIWDVFAVTTYATISAIFWYIGMIPDLASMRDRSTKMVQKVIYGIAAMGWRGSAVHWHRYEVSYLLFAGLATPLVISVHSIVALDFAVSVIPGWNTTIFPPYFVAGAVFSGFAMVLTLVIPVRALYGLKHIITMRHIDNMAKIMLATGLMVFYGYLNEMFFGWYSAHEYEMYMMWNRMTGPYAYAFWSLIFCNGLVPQLLWFKKVRRNTIALLIIAIIINIGMWLERFVIVVTSLHRDFLPSSWDMYTPTKWDWAMYAGTIGFFMFAMLLFIRWVPMISIFEVKEVNEKHHGSGNHH